MRPIAFAIVTLMLAACGQEPAQLKVPKVSSRSEAVEVLRTHFPQGWRIRGLRTAAGVTGISLEPENLVTFCGAKPGDQPHKGLFSILINFDEPVAPEIIAHRNRHFKEVVLKQFEEVSTRIQNENFPMLTESYRTCSERMRQFSHTAYRTPEGTVWITVRYLPTDRFESKVVEELKRMKSVVEAMLEREPGCDWEWPMPVVALDLASASPQ
jgi:hypothetical protein